MCSCLWMGNGGWENKACWKLTECMPVAMNEAKYQKKLVKTESHKYKNEKAGVDKEGGAEGRSHGVEAFRFHCQELSERLRQRARGNTCVSTLVRVKNIHARMHNVRSGDSTVHSDRVNQKRNQFRHISSVGSQVPVHGMGPSVLHKSPREQGCNKIELSHFISLSDRRRRLVLIIERFRKKKPIWVGCDNP